MSSEFKLKLDTGLFDTLLKDFWATLSGVQTMQLADIHLQNPIAVNISGIHSQVSFDFPPPLRNGTAREWELASKNLSATLTVDKVDANQIITQDIGGIHVHIRITGECHNIQLVLPPGQTHISAIARADLVEGKVLLSLPSFQGDWQPDSWQIKSMDCTGPNGFDRIVAQQTLAALRSIHNFDNDLHAYMTQKLSDWSAQASQILLASQVIPTNRDDLKVFYEPKFAENTPDGGISLQGVMQFVFPLVSPEKDIDNYIALDAASSATPATNSSLIMPFDTVQSLLTGSYMSGSFDFSVKSNTISGFNTLMHNTLAKLFVWTDLLRFHSKSVFLFKTAINGGPSFKNPSNTADGAISANLFMPLSIRTYAPIKNNYVPYVEFITQLEGPAKLQLVGSSARIQMQTSGLKIKTAWSKSYLSQYNPITWIAKSLMASTISKELNHQGLDLPLPQFKVGTQTQLLPTSMQMDGSNLRIQFTATNGILSPQ